MDQTGSEAHPIGTGGLFPPGSSGRDVKVTTQHLVSRPRMVELYLQFPKCLHGIVIKQAQGQFFIKIELLCLKSSWLLCGTDSFALNRTGCQHNS
jgi:hypothetical protein